MAVEALTGNRQTIVNTLNKLKHADSIESFWTRDGSIFAKKTNEPSKVKLVSLDCIPTKLGVPLPVDAPADME